MSKKIIINTPKGQYELPLKVVAEDRATWYEPDDNQAYQEQVDYVMDNNFEGIDWLLNNMDWVFVKAFAVKINDKVMVTDDDFWTDSDDFKIVG